MSTNTTDVLTAVCDGNVGFGHIAVIFGAVYELAERNPTLAANLANVGQYLADDLAFKLDQAQDAIEEERDGAYCASWPSANPDRSAAPVNWCSVSTWVRDGCGPFFMLVRVRFS